MKGDREQGLAAGMDEYLIKPLQLQDLARTIEKWAAKSNGTPQAAPCRFDPNALLKSVNGDVAAARRLAGIFLESTPPLLANIHGATEQRDAPALLRAAHTLHGSLTHLGEVESRRAVAELEQMSRVGNLDNAALIGAELERRLSAYQELLRRWLERQT